jgi:hypothetical protein
MIFAGRDDEQQRFREWVEREPPLDRAAALLVGPAGSGKSALLRRFAEICRGHEPAWFVFAAEINGSEATAAFFERLLADIHGLFAGRYLSEGPHDARLRTVLVKAIPTIGDLLSTLVKEDRRPAWQRLESYLGAVSRALSHAERFVLLVDPDRALQAPQAEDWLTLANRVPPRVRIVLAQRPDDGVAAHLEAATRFGWFGDTLGDLDAATVKAWWDGEMTERLVVAARSWSPEVRGKVGASAYETYRGYAFAHEALIRYLATTRPQDPLRVLARWPRDVENLFTTLYAALTRQGAERIRIALTLQIFGIPTPREVWAQTAGLEVERVIAALADPAFLMFFPRHGEPYRHRHARRRPPARRSIDSPRWFHPPIVGRSSPILSIQSLRVSPAFRKRRWPMPTPAGYGEDQVVGMKRHAGGEVGDLLASGEDHLAGASVLHQLVVDPALKGELLGIADLAERPGVRPAVASTTQREVPAAETFATRLGWWARRPRRRGCIRPRSSGPARSQRGIGQGQVDGAFHTIVIGEHQADAIPSMAHELAVRAFTTFMAYRGREISSSDISAYRPVNLGGRFSLKARTPSA